MTIDSLLQTISISYDAKASSIPTIIIREDAGKTKHQSLLVQVQTQTEVIFWIRLERATNDDRARGLFSRSSNFRADDTATLTINEEDLVNRSGLSNVKCRIDFEDPGSLSLFMLRTLLASLQVESKPYTLLQQNSSFLSSTVILILSDMYPNQMTGDPGSQSLGLELRGRIQVRFREEMERHANDPDEPLSSGAEESAAVSPTPSPMLFGRTHCFSNFSSHPVRWKGHTYPTAEHLFHSFSVSSVPVDTLTSIPLTARPP
jgi:hypothetical protein